MPAKQTNPSAEMRPIFNFMKVEDIRLRVHLGCEREERAIAQEVSFSVHLLFAEPPRALHTDALTDTVCYADIAMALRRLTEQCEYGLIEKLAMDGWTEVTKLLPANTRCQIEVHKLHPPVADLRGGVRYACGDKLTDDFTTL